MTTRRVFINQDQSDHISISDYGLYEDPQNTERPSVKSVSRKTSGKQIQYNESDSPDRKPTPHSINIKEYNYNNKIYNVNINSSNSEIIEKIHRQDFSFIDNICNTIEEKENNLNNTDFNQDLNEDIQFKVYKSTSNKTDNYKVNTETNPLKESLEEIQSPKSITINSYQSNPKSIKPNQSQGSLKLTRNTYRKTKTSEDLGYFNAIKEPTQPRLPTSNTKFFLHRRAFLPSNSIFDKKLTVSSSDTSNNINKSYQTYNSKQVSKSSRSVSEVEDEKESIRLMHRKRRASVQKMIVKFASRYEEKNFAFLNDLFEFRAKTEDENKSRFLFHKAKFAEGLTAFFTLFSIFTLLYLDIFNGILLHNFLERRASENLNAIRLLLAMSTMTSLFYCVCSVLRKIIYLEVKKSVLEFLPGSK